MVDVKSYPIHTGRPISSIRIVLSFLFFSFLFFRVAIRSSAAAENVIRTQTFRGLPMMYKNGTFHRALNS